MFFKNVFVAPNQDGHFALMSQGNTAGHRRFQHVNIPFCTQGGQSLCFSSIRGTDVNPGRPNAQPLQDTILALHHRSNGSC